MEPHHPPTFMEMQLTAYNEILKGICIDCGQEIHPFRTRLGILLPLLLSLSGPCELNQKLEIECK